jgi:hypothetical protein
MSEELRSKHVRTMLLALLNALIKPENHPKCMCVIEDMQWYVAIFFLNVVISSSHLGLELRIH